MSLINQSQVFDESTRRQKGKIFFEKIFPFWFSKRVAFCRTVQKMSDFLEKVGHFFADFTTNITTTFLLIFRVQTQIS